MKYAYIFYESRYFHGNVRSRFADQWRIIKQGNHADYQGHNVLKGFEFQYINIFFCNLILTFDF